MAYDLLIKNGTVVDGTGAARVRADVAIKDGTIAEIGKVSGGAQRTIDAGELIVAPGFVDPHTHYDAQICWDPLITLSSWHGVTSVVMGNCGVGIAPCRPEVREIAAWDLVNVEAIPFDVLSKGITWDWVSFPQFMDAAARRGSGINLGFFAPLTPFRHFAMGEESMERAATPAETAQIAALLREAVSAGAMGFSTTISAQHIGYKGRPLACRNASRDELMAYSGVLGEMGRGAMEVALTKAPGILAEDEYELLDMLLSAKAAGPPPGWRCSAATTIPTPVSNRSTARSRWCKPRRRAAGHLPPARWCRSICASHSSWPTMRHVESGLQPAARSPETDLPRPRRFARSSAANSARPGIFTGQWQRMEIKEVGNPALQARSKRGRWPIVARRARAATASTRSSTSRLEDDLRMDIQYTMFNVNEEGIGELLRDPRTMLGFPTGAPMSTC